MAAQISQLDVDSDGTTPEYFVQIRVPTGETPSGSIEFYDSRNANSAQLDNAFTIDLDTATPTDTLTEGGYDYYTYQITGDLTAGNGQNFAVAVLDDSGTAESVLIFGSNTAPGDTTFSGGALNGDDVDTVIASGVVEGDAFQSGEGPFIVAPDGSVTTGPADPSASACFAAGTRIATPGGEVAVETLRAGDVVCTADGGRTTVLWLGVFTAHKMFTRPVDRFLPVHVRAGALGPGVPHADLVLTADHALMIDGLAINAGALVNGTSIVTPPVDSLPERMTYYHVETQAHDVILANGAPAETYIDYVGRQVFANYAEYRARFDQDRVISEMRAPRISSARLVPPAIRARLGRSTAA